MSPFQNLTLAFFFPSSHKMPFVDHAIMSLANWLHPEDKDSFLESVGKYTPGFASLIWASDPSLFSGYWGSKFSYLALKVLTAFRGSFFLRRSNLIGHFNYEEIITQ